MSKPYDKIMHVEVPNDATLPQLSIKTDRVADGDTQIPMIPAKQPFQYEHLLKSDTFSSHSLFRLNHEGYHGDSWNERFQRALALPETKIEQKLLKYTLLNEINRDFISAAVVYAKTIISEYFIPDGEKSLRPQAIGGQAGNTAIWSLIKISLVTRSYSYRNLS
jgi:Clustered mitochondria